MDIVKVALINASNCLQGAQYHATKGDSKRTKQALGACAKSLKTALQEIKAQSR